MKISDENINDFALLSELDHLDEYKANVIISIK